VPSVCAAQYALRNAPPVQLLSGDDCLARVELERDFALLAAAGSGATTRVWQTSQMAVVLGVSLRVDREVDLDGCRDEGVAVLRRSSGGGAVVVGEGTLQYAFVLPYEHDAELATIPGSKRFCNRITMAALAAAGAATDLRADESGDLCWSDRKVAGVALKRSRHAMLLHGTILLEADLDRIHRLLRHPEREPAYRAGRSHRDFLANLGPIDVQRFAAGLATGVGAPQP